MVAAQNPQTDIIQWGELETLAQRHCDMTLDALLDRVAIKSRDELERLTGTHEEAMKKLANSIAQWRLTVRVYVSETRIAKNSSPYLSLSYGFGTVAVFNGTVNQIFRNTAHLIIDWRQKGYVYEFNPYILVTLYIARNGYPAISKLEDAPMTENPQDVEIHPNLHKIVEKRYSNMSTVDRQKFAAAYAKVLAHAYEQAEKQDESNGWFTPDRSFIHVDYVKIAGLLERRRVKLSAIASVEQYRITPEGAAAIGRAFPVQLDALPSLPLDDENIDDDDEVEQILAMETRLEREQAESDDEPTVAKSATVETEEAAPAEDNQADDDPVTDEDEIETAPVDDEEEELISWAKFINGQAPRIEVKTLIQPLNGTTAHADKELADHLNDCWEKMDITITTVMDTSGDYPAPHTTRIVTLQRTTSKPAGRETSAYAAAYIPQQRMVTPVGDPVVFHAPVAPETTLNRLITGLPVANALRTKGTAAVRQQMNDELLAAGQEAYDATLNRSRRKYNAIPAHL